MKIEQAKQYLEVVKTQVEGTLQAIGPAKLSIMVDIGHTSVQVDGVYALNIRRQVVDFLKQYIADVDKPIHTAQSFPEQKQPQESIPDNSGMIDWFRGEILFNHEPLPSGKLISIDSAGTLEFQSDKSFTSRGSHESTLRLKSANINSDGVATTLMIDGNISKFVQGHNVFGSLNLNKILLKAFNLIIQNHSDIFSYTDSFTQLKNIAQAEKRIEEGYYLVKMLDINFIYDLGSDLAVEQWLYSASINARSQSGAATKSKKGNTVYIQQHSRRWSMKWYNKFREITSSNLSHRLKQEFFDSGLPKFTEGKLRSELRLMALELKDLGIKFGSQLTPSVLTGLYNDYLEKIEMKPNKLLIEEELQNLPRSVARTYDQWKQGVDIKASLPDRTYYRHRRSLMEIGVDISIPPLQVDVPNNVIPMMRVIEANPVQNPQWAYDKGLIAV